AHNLLKLLLGHDGPVVYFDYQVVASQVVKVGNAARNDPGYIDTPGTLKAVQLRQVRRERPDVYAKIRLLKGRILRLRPSAQVTRLERHIHSVRLVVVFLTLFEDYGCSPRL